MERKGYRRSRISAAARSHDDDWKDLNINYVTIAEIDQDRCIECGRCYIACEDTSHQAISAAGQRRTVSTVVNEGECVGCNLCQLVARSRNASPWCIRPRASIRAPGSHYDAAARELDGPSEQSGGPR